MLGVWGKSDPFFLLLGSEAFKRGNPSAEVHFYDTGHFVLETHAECLPCQARASTHGRAVLA